MIEIDENRYNELLETERKYHALTTHKRLTKNQRILLTAIDLAIEADGIPPKCIIFTVKKQLSEIKQCSERMIRKMLADLPVLAEHKLISIDTSGRIITKLEQKEASF